MSKLVKVAYLVDGDRKARTGLWDEYSINLMGWQPGQTVNLTGGMGYSVIAEIISITGDDGK